jgi:hypothetical protein
MRNHVTARQLGGLLDIGVGASRPNGIRIFFSFARLPVRGEDRFLFLFLADLIQDALGLVAGNVWVVLPE